MVYQGFYIDRAVLVLTESIATKLIGRTSCSQRSVASGAR